MLKKNPIAAALAVAAIVGAGPAAAQTAPSLKGTVERALAGNPEVSARYNALRAATDTVDIARSGQGPRLDLSADLGYERSTFTNGPRETLSRSGVGLTLTQVLWDGMGTRNEITRSGHERLSRYFELLDTTEQTALEAARAHYDVLRFRHLVTLAEDNVVQHKQAADKIQSRVSAGVGRGVDLEQANARLALAESNLTTEIANLHDVSARYQRIVGEPPAKDLGALTLLDRSLPGSAGDALKLALSQNPAISASIESLRAARAAVQTRESALQPRVEARVRTGAGHNYNSVDSRRTDSAAEIVLNWNLFDGGADRARIRQQSNVLNQAADLRDKACRDARQTAEIAFNDTVKLSEQLVLLDRNTQAIERAREAYRQQFDISQRSLLDLLNAENESYTARRALSNAQYDRAIAYARTQAAMNQLNAQLGIARGPQADEAPGWQAGDDAAGRCPAQAIEVAAADSRALAQRAAATAVPAIAAVPAAAAAPAPARAAALPISGLNSRVNAWAEAWRTKNFDQYAAFYAPGFTGSEPSATAWRIKRQKMLAKPGPIGLVVDGLNATDAGNGLAETRFRQSYTSSNFKDVSNKVLTWKQVDGQWLIVKESNR